MKYESIITKDLRQFVILFGKIKVVLLKVPKVKHVALWLEYKSLKHIVIRIGREVQNMENFGSLLEWTL